MSFLYIPKQLIKHAVSNNSRDECEKSPCLVSLCYARYAQLVVIGPIVLHLIRLNQQTTQAEERRASHKRFVMKAVMGKVMD